MDSASRKASDGPAAKAEPDLRAEAPGDKPMHLSERFGRVPQHVRDQS